MMNCIDAALAQARRQGVDRLDAQVLLAHLLHRPRSWLLAHGDAPLDEPMQAQFAQLLQQRLDDVPVAYLIGQREFHGLTLKVTPAVLDPRPDTETLVGWALALLTNFAGRPRVVDLGTGSGAVALAVAASHRHSEVWATDASHDALAVARDNAHSLQLPVQFAQGDWWQPLAGQRFALAVSNPPYVAEGDPHLPALRHEPLRALASGADGLDDIRRIVADAPAHLAPGGWLLLEHGADQASAVRQLLAAAGLGEIDTRTDLAGLPRCTGGRAPAHLQPHP